MKFFPFITTEPFKATEYPTDDDMLPSVMKW